MHRRTSVLVALPLPRHGESAAADLAASHTGLGILFLPIEGVPAHASAISTGAVAVFRACRRRVVRRRARAWLCSLQRALSPIICLFKIWLTLIYLSFGRVAGFLPALGCGSVVWRACHVLEGSCSNPALIKSQLFLSDRKSDYEYCTTLERKFLQYQYMVENRSNTNREIARAAMAPRDAAEPMMMRRLDNEG